MPFPMSSSGTPSALPAGRRRHGGFTLLEAIVALVLISGTGLALYGWINTNLISLYRVQQSQLRSDAMHSALDYMRSVNPAERPRGTAKLGPYRLRWTAQLVEAERDGAGYGAGLSLYRLGLYDTAVEIITASGEALRVDLRLVGYRQVRSLEGRT